jgi:hypothetical protein
LHISYEAGQLEELDINGVERLGGVIVFCRRDRLPHRHFVVRNGL